MPVPADASLRGTADEPDVGVIDAFTDAGAIDANDDASTSDNDAR